MTHDPRDIDEGLAALRRRLGARAAGAWRVEGDRLVGLAFATTDDMPPEVAGRFRAMSASVPLDLRDLGIVAAALDGRRRVSHAAELPPDAGSGLWLRAFAADRSVAVPIAGAAGAVVGVVSVALVGAAADDEVEDSLRRAASGWFATG